MEIKRDLLLKRLMDLRHNGMIKVVTGMRRCGKSYLLFNLFSDALRVEGVDEQHISSRPCQCGYVAAARQKHIPYPAPSQISVCV